MKSSIYAVLFSVASLVGEKNKETFLDVYGTILDESPDHALPVDCEVRQAVPSKAEIKRLIARDLGPLK